jgi:ferritin-like metal-binding protein YciE
MPQLASPADLFVHELQDVYYAEQTLAKVLPKLADEVEDRELATTLKQHQRETQQHVKNLERVFQEIGAPAQGEKCPGIDGIKEEHDVFMKENNPSDEVRDVFVTGAAARTEHYEIAAYNGLIGMARSLGERRSVELLDKNLKQEKEALRKVETISKRLLKQAVKAEKARA